MRTSIAHATRIKPPPLYRNLFAAFLDSSDLRDLNHLFDEGVHQSEVLLVLLTSGILTRPWCLMEIWEAHSRGIPIVTVDVVGKDYSLAAARRGAAREPL